MKVALCGESRTALDKVCRDLSSNGLQKHFNVESRNFSTTKALFESMHDEQYDALVFEEGVKGVNGFDVIRWQQQHMTQPVPLLIFVDNDGFININMVFDVEVNEYIVKSAPALMGVHDLLLEMPVIRMLT